MESIIQPKKKLEVGYPKLMKGCVSGEIVLFSAQSYGTVVYSVDKRRIGLHSKDYNNEKFIDWDGKVILQNNIDNNQTP